MGSDLTDKRRYIFDECGTYLGAVYAKKGERGAVWVYIELGKGTVVTDARIVASGKTVDDKKLVALNEAIVRESPFCVAVALEEEN